MKRDPKVVQCPYCDAAPGERCRVVYGRTAGLPAVEPHTARFFVAHGRKPTERSMAPRPWAMREATDG